MPLYIQTNVASLEAQRNLNATNGVLAKSFQRLSSGFRINSAADDAAGLSISESLKAQIRSYAVAERNASNGISVAETAEAALGSLSGIMGRMRELAVQASNGDLTTTDRSFLNIEFGELQSEIDRIANATKFNGNAILQSTSLAFQVGIYNSAATTDRITIAFTSAAASNFALASGDAVVSGNVSNAQAAITSIDAGLATLNGKRASMGAMINRLQVTVSNLQSIRTNLSAANSRIRDVDVAEETSVLARTQVIAQAGAAVLAQANQSPQLALALLR